jgi:hypothetical protein
MLVQTGDVGDVLVEGSTECHVDDLHPPTDAEHRSARAVGLQQQIDLERIPMWVDAVVIGVASLPISVRVHVTSTDEHESVEGLQDLGGRALVGRGEHVRTGAGPLQCLQVRGGDGYSSRIPTRHAACGQAVADHAHKRCAHPRQSRPAR